MPVYKKRVSTRDKRFKGRSITFIDRESIDRMSIADSEVICNSCNANVYSEEKETFGWLIYFSKADLIKDRPYDFYCDLCIERNFPKAIKVL